MENCLIPGMGQRMYKMILEHVVVPENKKVLKRKMVGARLVKRTQKSIQRSMAKYEII